MHPALEFIQKHLDDSFSSRVVWDSVKDHDHDNGFEMFLFACTPCQSMEYPCVRVREVLEFFRGEEGFVEDWTLGSNRGKVSS